MHIHRTTTFLVNKLTFQNFAMFIVPLVSNLYAYSLPTGRVVMCFQSHNVQIKSDLQTQSQLTLILNC